jgi:hypothetical protein
MHSMKNISERNKIDTQSRADVYIRRNRLISKSDYNLKSDEPKSILKTGKTLKKLSLLGKYIFKKKNQKKQKKNKKKTKKPLGWVFNKKNRVFSNPVSNCLGLFITK